MKRPELIVFDEAGKPLEHGNLLGNIVYRRTVNLHWPVESLPERMGWLPTAQALPEDRSKRYFLSVEASFSDEGMVVYGNRPSPDGDSPYEEIDYDELRSLVQESGTTISLDPNDPAILHLYCDFDPSDYGEDGPTRRLRAELCVMDKPERRPTSEDTTIPF
jgi:hypothetical protein